MRKRYAVVIIGTEGTAAAQKSELSRHRSEAAAREAAKAERRRLYLVRPDDVGRYMVIVEHDGVAISNDGSTDEPEVRQQPLSAFPLAPPPSGREPAPAPPPERRMREERMIEEQARRAAAPDSRVQRLGPPPETLREPLPPRPERRPTPRVAPAPPPPPAEPAAEPAAAAPPEREAVAEALPAAPPPPSEQPDAVPEPDLDDAAVEDSGDTGRMPVLRREPEEPRARVEPPVAAEPPSPPGRPSADVEAPAPPAPEPPAAAPRAPEPPRPEPAPRAPAPVAGARSAAESFLFGDEGEDDDEAFARFLEGNEERRRARGDEPEREPVWRRAEEQRPASPPPDEEEERERPDAPIRSRLDDIEVPSGPVPEEIIQRFAEMVRRDEERRQR